MMPGQPGMTREMCVEDFRQIFENPDWRPDYLKIYPTLVVEGTRVYDRWRQDSFEPLSNEEAADVADAMDQIPKYTRLQRVQRDIPADFIEGGVWKSNLRQLADQRAEEKGSSSAISVPARWATTTPTRTPTTWNSTCSPTRPAAGRNTSSPSKTPSATCSSGSVACGSPPSRPTSPARPGTEDDPIRRELEGTPR